MKLQAGTNVRGVNFDGGLVVSSLMNCCWQCWRHNCAACANVHGKPINALNVCGCGCHSQKADELIAILNLKIANVKMVKS